ncbi:AI-2E family transporter [Aestuariibius sp. HNIBRBA575]|uniref:AI-2E family transporter n=1 Tax=Aestuariibius sp. HNIBRBA575 TaxID=3233343 RepID=UPI0034A54FBF
MALPVQKQMQYWGIAAAIIVLLLWVLGDVLLPFILGGAIAYCLDPIADWFESKGLSRAMSVVVISLIAVMVFGIAFLLVVPSLISQASELIDVAPQLFENLRTFLGRQFADLIERFPQLADENSTISQQRSAIIEAIQARGGDFLSGLLSSLSGIVNIVLLIVIVPVVTFYLLLDWDRMVAQIDDMLPRDHAGVIRQLAYDCDRTLAAFIRGMGTVSLILGTYYAIALMAVGLNFGLVVGFIAGLITFIPYLGSLIGGALAIGLALFQYWGVIENVDGDTITYATDWFRIGVVTVIFVIGQMVEGNILTPKLVGSSVGLHPVWLILALSVFGSLFGFVGMLVAVPLAAMISVVARFFIGQYKTGRLYQGIAGQDLKDE